MTGAITPTRPMRGEGRRGPGVRRIYEYDRDIKVYVVASARARNLTVSRFDRHQTEYHAFLLRIWRDDARQGWRALLQITATGQRFHFGTLDELFAFLDARLEAGDGERWPNPRSP